VSRRSREDWARFAASSIPTKTDLTVLERFLDRIPRGRALDLGCGVGEGSRWLSARGFSVVGVDINEDALAGARKTAPSCAFHLRDVAAPGGLDLEGAFDLVVCQLVVSIVGGLEARRRLLDNAFRALAPGGRLYLSASGVSDDINPAYARLYEQDYPLTGERHTYGSRDASGNVLYETHHFEEEELRLLIESAGFEAIEILRKEEASSRRQNERAWFLYALCRGRLPNQPYQS
jgi:SAM-dependent methyltransferase